MANQVNLAAASRRQTGNGAARSLRRSGQVPGGHLRPRPRARAARRRRDASLSRLLARHDGQHHRRRHGRRAGPDQGADPRDPAPRAALLDHHASRPLRDPRRRGSGRAGADPPHRHPRRRPELRRRARLRAPRRRDPGPPGRHPGPASTWTSPPWPSATRSSSRDLVLAKGEILERPERAGLHGRGAAHRGSRGPGRRGGRRPSPS